MLTVDREEFVKELTPFDSWKQFLKEKEEYENENIDKPAS